jgi:hypothetical protein
MGQTNLDVLAATNVVAPIQYPVELAAANGAIASKAGVVMLTKAGVAAMTLAAPTAGTDDGKVLIIAAATANARTVTQTTPGFNNAGDSFQLVAFNGRWHVLALRNVTLA